MRFINDADATEQSFTLRGLARKPVAKKTLTYNCRVGDTIERSVRVENVAKWKLVYRVQSDLPFVTGDEHCTVFSGAAADYKFSIAPLYHGTFHGVLRFVATRDPFVEHDSDDEELYCLQNEFSHPFEMWFALNVRVEPGEPVARVAVEGHCLDKSSIQIPLLDACRALLARSAAAAALPGSPPNPSSALSGAARSSPGARSTPSASGGVVDERTQFEVNLVDPTGFLRALASDASATASQAQDAASGMRSRDQSLSFARSASQSDATSKLAAGAAGADESKKTSKQNKAAVNVGALTITEGRDEVLRLQYMPTKMGKYKARYSPLSRLIVRYDLRIYPIVLFCNVHSYSYEYLCCSVTLVNKQLGEFWYDLDLIATPPAPIVLQHMQCEIGHWVSAEVVLHNPCREKLVLEPHVESAKSGCFALHYAPGARDLDSNRSDAESEELTFAAARVPKTLQLQPRASLALLLLFKPGALGFAGQKATITFRNNEVPLRSYIAL